MVPRVGGKAELLGTVTNAMPLIVVALDVRPLEVWSFDPGVHTQNIPQLGPSPAVGRYPYKDCLLTITESSW